MKNSFDEPTSKCMWLRKQSQSWRYENRNFQFWEKDGRIRRQGFHPTTLPPKNTLNMKIQQI